MCKIYTTYFQRKKTIDIKFKSNISICLTKNIPDYFSEGEFNYHLPNISPSAKLYTLYKSRQITFNQFLVLLRKEYEVNLTEVNKDFIKLQNILKSDKYIFIYSYDNLTLRNCYRTLLSGILENRYIIREYE